MIIMDQDDIKIKAFDALIHLKDALSKMKTENIIITDYLYHINKILDSASFKNDLLDVFISYFVSDSNHSISLKYKTLNFNLSHYLEQDKIIISLNQMDDIKNQFSDMQSDTKRLLIIKKAQLKEDIKFFEGDGKRDHSLKNNIHFLQNQVYNLKRKAQESNDIRLTHEICVANIFILCHKAIRESNSIMDAMDTSIDKHIDKDKEYSTSTVDINQEDQVGKTKLQYRSDMGIKHYKARN